MQGRERDTSMRKMSKRIQRRERDTSMAVVVPILPRIPFKLRKYFTFARCVSHLNTPLDII